MKNMFEKLREIFFIGNKSYFYVQVSPTTRHIYTTLLSARVEPG